MDGRSIVRPHMPALIPIITTNEAQEPYGTSPYQVLRLPVYNTCLVHPRPKFTQAKYSMDPVRESNMTGISTDLPILRYLTMPPIDLQVEHIGLLLVDAMRSLAPALLRQPFYSSLPYWYQFNRCICSYHMDSCLVRDFGIGVDTATSIGPPSRGQYTTRSHWRSISSMDPHEVVNRYDLCAPARARGLAPPLPPRGLLGISRSSFTLIWSPVLYTNVIPSVIPLQTRFIDRLYTPSSTWDP
ncbi:hypothetical protein G9A89_000281 [Geosiphon pyriformis]|nr:hypothetical protein G9A89_000281 [Geosiphon pyriformis]